MDDSFWDQFPKTVGIGCIEIKDAAQACIASETRGMSTEHLIAYFREANTRLREMDSAHPLCRREGVAVAEVRQDAPTK